MRHVAASIICLVVLGATACDQVEELLGSGPDATLAAYLEATRTGDYTAAYGYLSESDRSSFSG